MPKIVMTDYLFEDMSVEKEMITSAGVELVSNRSREPHDFGPLITDADAVMVQFATLDEQMIHSMKRAKAIVRYGIGYDNVDCQAARKKGIPVCNIPDYCIDEVADHTLAFILATTRGLRANCSKLVKGEWGLGTSIEQMKTLRDQTVGLVGAGRIGKEVIARLKPFKCNLLVFDPYLDQSAGSQLGVTLVEFDELLKNSDIVSLHCPSNEQTRNIINATSIQIMKKGSIFINVGRGDLADLAAVTDAIQSGRISAAALDVFDQEPLTEHPLYTLDNVLVNSHIASVSPTAISALRQSAARIAIAAVKGQPLPNIVNGL